MQLIELEASECRNMLGDFYDIVAKHLGHENPSKLKYDCKKINVNKMAWDEMWDFYRETVLDSQPDVSEESMNQAIAMMLIVYGPKNILVPDNIDDELKFLVGVEDGFIMKEGQDDESCESI